MGTKTKILVAYVAGQATQLVVHGMALSFNMWNNRQIPFCLAAGFVVFFAILSGVLIATEKTEPAHEKKSYLDYAKIPEEEDTPKFATNKK